jgi:succinoglycan biosynthesis transport protein ExoP
MGTFAPSHVTHDDPRLAEAFRVLRYALDGRGPQAKVVAVTSPETGDGRTTVAFGLAMAFAATREALLVDADLARGDVATRLGMGHRASHGLPGAVRSGRITGAVVDPALEARGPVSRLSVLPAGPPMRQTWEIFDSPAFGLLLAEARERWNTTVLDAPPAGTADCRALAPWIDGYVVVISAGRTTHAALAEALAALPSDRILGVILNRAPLRRAPPLPAAVRPAPLIQLSREVESTRSNRRDGK